MNSAPRTKSKPKRFQTILAAVMLSASAAASYAQSTTVNFTAGVGQRDVTFNGATPVPDGNQVQVGYFTPGFDVPGNAANVLSLADNWHSMGSTTIRSIFGQPGRFGADLITFDSAFTGQKICLWIFQTTDNGAPLSSFQNLQGYGLYSSTALNWFFPDPNNLFPNNGTSVNSSEVNQSYFGSYDSSHLILTQVPEPGACALLLAGLGAFAVWGRGARRSKIVRH